MSQIKSKLSTACSIAVALAALLWIVLSLGFDFYYDLNDDTTIRDIVSGIYTGMPDGHNAQTLFPLGWILAGLYKLCPNVPWFGGLLAVITFGTVAVLLWAALSCFSSVKSRIVMGVLCCLCYTGLWLYECIFIQYTAVAGLAMAAAIVLLWKDCYIGAAVLAVLSCNLRSEMMLFLVPLLLSTLVIKGIWNRKTIAFVIGTILAIAACFAIDAAAYAGEDWSSYRKLFDARTTVYDYTGVPSYEEHEDFYDSLQMGEKTVALLENYNFDLTDAVNADSMGEIASYAKSHEPLSFGRNLYLAVYTYVYRFLHGEELLWDVLLLVTYIIVWKSAVSRRDGKGALYTIGLFAMRSALWIFLLYNGRVPERITHPFYLTEWMVLLGLLLMRDDITTWKPIRKHMVIGLFSVICICGLFLNGGKVTKEYTRREEMNAKWDTLRNAMRADTEHFYLLDVYSTVPFSEKMFTGETPVYRNYDCMGGWLVKSPLAKEKRMVYGFADAAEGLLSGKAFFVSDHTKEERKPDFIKEYFAEQSTAVTINKVTDVSDFSVYQIEK